MRSVLSKGMPFRESLHEARQHYLKLVAASAGYDNLQIRQALGRDNSTPVSRIYSRAGLDIDEIRAENYLPQASTKAASDEQEAAELHFQTHAHKAGESHKQKPVLEFEPPLKNHPAAQREAA